MSRVAGAPLAEAAGGERPAIRPLARAELPADTIALARFLIGVVLVHDAPGGRMAGRIVETEAYPIGDAACHAYRGLTPRNRALFLERGHAYVYLIYGVWYCANVSSEADGVGAGVLLRAVEPVEGAALMARQRPGVPTAELTRGPGRLAAAMAIDRRFDGVDLCGPGPLWLGVGERPRGCVGTSARIGLTRAADKPWRFYERGNPFVSGPRRLRE
jgi:DNA-3-methyladenine glycosylase